MMLQMQMQNHPQIKLMMDKVTIVNAAINGFRDPITSDTVTFKLDKKNKLTLTCKTAKGYHSLSATMLSENNMDSTTISIGNNKTMHALRDTQINGIDRANPTIGKHINDGMAYAYRLLLKA